MLIFKKIVKITIRIIITPARITTFVSFLIRKIDEWASK